ncbi:MAG: 4Fe-4S binding protein [Desulfocucumaceae bacterium]
MKVVTLMASVDGKRCRGCKTCERVCPVLAVKVVNKLSVIDQSSCRGCAACEQRCPEYAIDMVKREEPFTVQVDVEKVPYQKIAELCEKARFNPEQLLCYCTATRAEEVAAAILLGSKTPEEVSLTTGIRTGCKVECIQPVLRLLEAAGIRPEPPKKGWQWYGRTPTIWEIPVEIRDKYNRRGFYFDEDIVLLDRVAAAKPLDRRGQ